MAVVRHNNFLVVFGFVHEPVIAQHTVSKQEHDNLIEEVTTFGTFQTLTNSCFRLVIISSFYLFEVLTIFLQ